MPNLLNSFGRTKTYVSNDGYIVFESSVPGTYPISLGSGIYHVVLIGGGGGGAHRFWRYHSPDLARAQGGVGATIDCIVRIEENTIASVVVGAPGETKAIIDQGSATVLGSDGTSSGLYNIQNITLVASNGTGGRISGDTTLVAGVMGAASIIGNNILKVNMNSNDNPIVSQASTSYFSPYGAIKNTNYMPNTSLGQGGGSDMEPLSNPPLYQPGPGYCLIEKIDINLYDL